MPYFIYDVVEKPMLRLSKIAAYPSFKEASAQAKQLRAAATQSGIVKVIFAANELEAEDLLSQVRVPPPVIGDDY